MVVSVGQVVGIVVQQKAIARMRRVRANDRELLFYVCLGEVFTQDVGVPQADDQSMPKVSVMVLATANRRLSRVQSWVPAANDTAANKWAST